MSSSAAQQPRPLPGPAVVKASSVHQDDPNRDQTESSSSTSTPILHPHRLPHRRFIGPLPESVINSTEVEDARRWYHNLRETLMRQEHEGRGRADKQGDWTDQGRTRGPIETVEQIGRRVGEHVRHPLHGHSAGARGNTSDGHSLFAESYMTDDTRGTTPTPNDPGPSSGLFSRWRRDRKPRRPNVWHGESFDIGSSFRPLRTMSCNNTLINTSSSGSGSNVRCFKKYGGLIDVDDEYLTTSEEEEEEEAEPHTLYGSPKSYSIQDGEPESRPDLRSRGTGTTTQSFQTARTHQPGPSSASAGSFLTPPRLTNQSRATSTTTTRTDDFHSALSSIPPASTPGSTPGLNQFLSSSPELFPSISNRSVRGGSSSTADHGSTRRLIPPATGISYDTSGRSDQSGNHVGIPPVQPELADQVAAESSGRRASAPLPRSRSGSRLKSALKFRSRATNGSEEGGRGEESRVVGDGIGGGTVRSAKKTKTVQFPVGRELDDRGSESVNGLKSRFRGLRERLKDEFEHDRDDGQEDDDDDTKSDHSLEPADPREVLARTGSEVVGTSAGVIEAHRARPGGSKATATGGIDPTANLSSSRDPRTERGSGASGNKGKARVGNAELGLDPTAQDDADAHPDAVVLRDRMLVRVGRNRERGLGGYDEAMSRRKPCSRLDRMEEYLVVYRKGRIELYQEWRLPLKERFVRTKRLCFSIPLHPKYTTFSLFSPVDLSFALCLDMEPFMEELQGEHGDRRAEKLRRRLKDSKQLQWLKGERIGSQVFIFNCRERIRAMDWMWEIWKDLDGVLPETLEVYVPDLQTTIKLPRPIEDSVGSMATCRTLSRSKVLKTAVDALKQFPTFDMLIESVRRETGEMPRLELAWKREEYLEWISKHDEKRSEGCKREWALLAGLSIISPGHNARLELRPARHSTSMMKLSDGTSLEEPPCLEGYLYRLGRKQGKASREQIYVYSFDGNLFSSLPRNAQTPLPPQHIEVSGSATDFKLLDTFMSNDFARGSRNLLECTGFVDFRDIVAVRGKRLKPKKTVIGAMTGATDVEDAPEVAHVSKGSKVFEMVLDRSGEKVRFEAHSPEAAKEWIDRLRQLHEYWSHRQRVDARSRMDSVRSALRGADKFLYDVMESDDTPELNLQWNWCPIEGCSPVIHAGRLFVKHSQNSQFRAYYTVLTQGYLVTFSFERSAFHVRRNRYSLLEAYIYSGVLAESELTSVLREDAFTGEARIYQDGLETADVAEDCTFAIWMRKHDHHRVASSASKGRHFQERLHNDDNYTPPFLGKPASKLIIMRARSKLERDKWIRILQIEIQRQADAHPERTSKARGSGLVPE